MSGKKAGFKTVRAEVLATAEDLVTGDREAIYGTPQQNFTRIAALWSVVLGRNITQKEVALCLALLKVARLVNTPGHQDSWVDLAGYSALGAEVENTTETTGEEA